MYACVLVQGWAFQGTGETWHGGSNRSYLKTWGEGDVIAFELDADKDTLEFFVNNQGGGEAFSGLFAKAGGNGLAPAIGLYRGGDSVVLMGVKTGQVCVSFR